MSLKNLFCLLYVVMLLNGKILWSFSGLTLVLLSSMICTCYWYMWILFFFLLVSIISRLCVCLIFCLTDLMFCAKFIEMIEAQIIELGKSERISSLYFLPHSSPKLFSLKNFSLHPENTFFNFIQAPFFHLLF